MVFKSVLNLKILSVIYEDFKKENWYNQGLSNALMQFSIIYIFLLIKFETF